ncbi:MAG: hypothetical protein KBT69_10305 [Oceanihabitans sp.]|nr:hypothetical protein [Oceanihabitans sp.]
MKKPLLKLSILLVAFTLFNACQNEDYLENQEESISVEEQKEPLTISELNAIINESLTTTGTFDWKDVDAHTLWSAVVRGENILTIGYGQEDESFAEVKTEDLKATLANVLQIVEDYEGYTKSRETVIEHDIINVVDVKVENLETIQQLFKSEGVRYLEPNGYNH